MCSQLNRKTESLEREKHLNQDVELQEIQTFDNYFQAQFNLYPSIVVAGFIGLLVVLLTVYYDGLISGHIVY